MSLAELYAKKINDESEACWPEDLLAFDDVRTSLVEHEIIDQLRWSYIVRSVYFFVDDASFIAVETEEGATEYQDLEPNGRAYEVEARQVTKYEYVQVAP